MQPTRPSPRLYVACRCIIKGPTASIAYITLQVPLVGPSVDRRTLNLLTKDYNDADVRALVCFACGQKHVATPGPNSAIEYQTTRWFAERGEDTLRMNIGWKRWLELLSSI